MLRASACFVALTVVLSSSPSDLFAAESCKDDYDCYEGEICNEGTCRPEKGSGGFQAEEEYEQPPADRREETETGPDSAGGLERGTRLGLTNEVLIGFAGDLGYKNVDPVYVLMLDLGFAIGRYMRWHIQFGYENIVDSGIRFNPLVFGYAIPVYTDGKKLAVEVELIFALAQSETFFGDIMTGSVSSGIRAQGVLRYDMFFAAVAPIGFEARYFLWTENATDGGFGTNWPLALTLGIEQ